MRKSAEAFRTISEVATMLDVPAHVLRFWESRFTQIAPVKRGGGRRYYRPADVTLLRGIQHLLYEDGLTIKGVQKILKDKGIKHVNSIGTVEPVAAAPVDLAAIIAQLETLRTSIVATL
ncbi:MAG: MerR family transcriptional regulator [Rhodobacteraceae bacterium]|nr:MerR family transcriptional regulator [Paracoccaceae bacterium]